MALPTIKICGLRDLDAASVAVEAGTSALGFIFAASRRQVSAERVAGIIENLPRDRPPAVGVVVNPTLDDIECIQRAGVDIIQLSGDESPQHLDLVEVLAWKAFRFPAGTTRDAACCEIEPWLAGPRRVTAIMVDAAVSGAYGGTGHRADWDLVATLAERYPLILAGGLTPGNVTSAIEQVRPLGVDVSSGVERDGAKDLSLIREFVAVSRQAFAQLAIV